MDSDTIELDLTITLEVPMIELQVTTEIALDLQI